MHRFIRVMGRNLCGGESPGFVSLATQEYYKLRVSLESYF